MPRQRVCRIQKFTPLQSVRLPKQLVPTSEVADTASTTAFAVAARYIVQVLFAASAVGTCCISVTFPVSTAIFTVPTADGWIAGWVDNGLADASGWGGTGVVWAKDIHRYPKFTFVLRVCHIIVHQAANLTLSIYELLYLPISD